MQAQGERNIIKGFVLDDFFTTHLLRENRAASLKGESQTVPFKFDESSREAPTEFELFFRTKSAKYRYNLHLKKDAVLYESLYKQHKKGRREVQIFVRESNKKSVTVGPELKCLSKTGVAERYRFYLTLKF